MTKCSKCKRPRAEDFHHTRCLGCRGLTEECSQSNTCKECQSWSPSTWSEFASRRSAVVSQSKTRKQRQKEGNESLAKPENPSTNKDYVKPQTVSNTVNSSLVNIEHHETGDGFSGSSNSFNTTPISSPTRHKHDKAISGHVVLSSDPQNEQAPPDNSSSDPNVNDGQNIQVSKQDWDSVMGKMSQFDTLSTQISNLVKLLNPQSHPQVSQVEKANYALPQGTLSPTKIKRLKTTHSDFQSTGSFDNTPGMTEATDEFGQTTFSGFVYPNMMDISMEDSILQDGIESTISAPNNLLPVHTQCVLSTNSEPDLDRQRYFDPEGFHQQQMLSLIGQKTKLSSNTELKPVNEISALQNSATKSSSKPQPPSYDPQAVVIEQNSSSDKLSQNVLPDRNLVQNKLTVDLDDANFVAKLRAAILEKDRHHSDEEELNSDEEMEQQSPIEKLIPYSSMIEEIKQRLENANVAPTERKSFRSMAQETAEGKLENKSNIDYLPVSPSIKNFFDLYTSIAAGKTAQRGKKRKHMRIGEYPNLPSIKSYPYLPADMPDFLHRQQLPTDWERLCTRLPEKDSCPVYISPKDFKDIRLRQAQDLAIISNLEWTQTCNIKILQEILDESNSTGFTDPRIQMLMRLQISASKSITQLEKSAVFQSGQFSLRERDSYLRRTHKNLLENDKLALRESPMLDNNIFDTDLVNSIRDKLQSDIQVMSSTRALELTSNHSHRQNSYQPRHYNTSRDKPTKTYQESSSAPRQQNQPSSSYSRSNSNDQGHNKTYGNQGKTYGNQGSYTQHNYQPFRRGQGRKPSRGSKPYSKPKY